MVFHHDNAAARSSTVAAKKNEALGSIHTMTPFTVQTRSDLSPFPVRSNILKQERIREFSLSCLSSSDLISRRYRFIEKNT